MAISGGLIAVVVVVTIVAVLLIACLVCHSVLLIFYYRRRDCFAQNCGCFLKLFDMTVGRCGHGKVGSCEETIEEALPFPEAQPLEVPSGPPAGLNLVGKYLPDAPSSAAARPSSLTEKPHQPHLKSILKKTTSLNANPRRVKRRGRGRARGGGAGRPRPASEDYSVRRPVAVEQPRQPQSQPRPQSQPVDSMVEEIQVRTADGRIVRAHRRVSKSRGGADDAESATIGGVGVGVEEDEEIKIVIRDGRPVRMRKRRPGDEKKKNRTKKTNQPRRRVVKRRGGGGGSGAEIDVNLSEAGAEGGDADFDFVVSKTTGQRYRRRTPEEQELFQREKVKHLVVVGKAATISPRHDNLRPARMLPPFIEAAEVFGDVDDDDVEEEEGENEGGQAVVDRKEDPVMVEEVSIQARPPPPPPPPMSRSIIAVPAELPPPIEVAETTTVPPTTLWNVEPSPVLVGEVKSGADSSEVGEKLKFCLFCLEFECSTALELREHMKASHKEDFDIAVKLGEF